MDQSTLAEILGVERDIRAQLDAEREQASRWLENARREIEQDHEARLGQLRAELQKRREAALLAARDRAAGLVQHAEAVAARQALAGDDDLRRLVRRHLATLLPEVAR
jgi:hypothetical protein